MRSLRAITVCVNYADLLARSLSRWHVGTDRLVVVTTPDDRQTLRLCDRNNVETFTTNIFTANGAHFNKGAALSEAILRTRLRNGADWLLTFDADIVPPDGFRDELEQSNLSPGTLYGTHRYWVREDAPLTVNLSRKMPQGWVLGFFCLFHGTDPRLPRGPLFDLHWPHAGCFDTTFARQWPKHQQEILPMPVIHLGDERQHWCGRGDYPTLKRKYLDKRQGWEGWQHEKMENPPTLKGD